MHGMRLKAALLLAVAAAVLGGLASTAEAKTAVGAWSTAAAPYKVGIVYSRTGLLAAYGAQYIQGLRYGLAYATKGTNSVNGRKIELTLADDGTDPVKAVSAAKDLIGKGYKILTGTVSSGVAMQLAPLAGQNKVLYIAGAAAADLACPGSCGRSGAPDNINIARQNAVSRAGRRTRCAIYALSGRML